jgi:protein-tyrosine phosphatase
MPIIDFHNHVMPGVDDGATTDDETVEALRAFVAQGVSHVVATPHFNASLTQRAETLAARLDELDAGWARLQRIAAAQVPGLHVLRGAEVMLDTPVSDLSDDRLRLAGTRFVLCEYPFMTIPPNSTGALKSMIESGCTPIIAHPERYVGAETDCALAAKWRDAGALLQINAGSLTGRYGERARANVHALLERGLADYMCSDYHSRGRISTGSAQRLLTALDGDEHFQLLTDTNPRRMLEGEMPLPVPPLRTRRGVADRVRRWLK